MTSPGQAPEEADLPASARPTVADVDSLLNRLTAAAHDLEAKQEAVGPARELRDQLIVEAREAGVSYTKVAKAGLCSRATVFTVLAKH